MRGRWRTAFGSISSFTLKGSACRAHPIQYLGYQRHRHVLQLAERADEQACRASHGVRAYTSAGLAAVQAHHDHTAALRTLTRAEHLYSRADTTPGRFTSHPFGALLYHGLGNYRKALDICPASLPLHTITRQRGPHGSTRPPYLGRRSPPNKRQQHGRPYRGRLGRLGAGLGGAETAISAGHALETGRCVRRRGVRSGGCRWRA
ncbi:hypothetical protein GCM10010371_68830 [Streptomyces subrutilus]|uniref:Tetratricopeptide repeat protein n=1 Tax=Streptomyces subrutilus TaxID=36818 RepID=A0A918RIX8_9ACTN|nr:hypothetical protein GCM10010371_68830 [Streptomyces subrutilus]